MGIKNKCEKIMLNECIYLREVLGEGFRLFLVSFNSLFFFFWFVFGVIFCWFFFLIRECKYFIFFFLYCRLKDLVKDFYLVFFVCVEVGFLYLEEGDLD